MTIQFSPHGSWQFCINNQVLIQTFYGAWNEEAMISYVKAFQETVQPLIQNDWAILSVFEEWELGVPEIEPYVEAHCQWFIDNGCTKDCHVYSKSYAKQMQLDKMIPFKDEHYERQVFTTFNEAQQWLAKCGFELKQTNFMDGLKRHLVELNDYSG